jgi:SEC-C motif-containing protein
MSIPCHCDSNKPFDACCARFLSGTEQAKTPVQLMRSRYTAYALGGHGKYLLRTWFPPTAGGLTAQALGRREREWIKLEVLARQQSGDKGWVEFKAWYRDGGAKEQVMHEKSVFQRTGGRWLYGGGEVTVSPDSD